MRESRVDVSDTRDALTRCAETTREVSPAATHATVTCCKLSTGPHHALESFEGPTLGASAYVY